MRQSLNIIFQVLNKIPKGSVKVNDHKIINPSRIEMKNSIKMKYLIIKSLMQLN